MVGNVKGDVIQCGVLVVNELDLLRSAKQQASEAHKHLGHFRQASRRGRQRQATAGKLVCIATCDATPGTNAI